MKTNPETSAVREVVVISVPLDAVTARRLEFLSKECAEDPTTIAASLLHDILEEDEGAHMLPGLTTSPVLN